MERTAAVRAVRMGFCVTALALGGCAGGGEGLLASSRGDGDSTLGNLLAFNKANPGPAPNPANERPITCPQIEVQDGTASSRSYAGADQSNGNVRYQFSMGDVARECSKAGNQILIKVGVAGRVLLGPAGAPGAFTVPVRIAIRRDKDQKAAASKLYQVAATVAPGETATDFSLVAEPLSVPFTQADASNDYTVLVGFDEQGKSSAVKPPRGRRAIPPG